MNMTPVRSACLAAALATLAVVTQAPAAVPLGTGNAALLGGDLADPEDDIVDKGSYAGDQSEEQLRPEKGNWVVMKCFPANPPGMPAHQRHAYQSWQDSPAVAIFLNKPAQRKWYVGFRDGGFGGPTDESPYFAAVQFSKPIILTHFTITTGPDMPGRDPRQWAIQGSNTGEDDDWTDIYRCDVPDRGASPLKEGPRCETTLFTSFTSADMAKAVPDRDSLKITAKLNGRSIDKADFARPAGGYTWLRIVIFSCFNASTMDVPDAARPPGFAIGQLELFGVPGTPAPSGKTAATVDPAGIEPVPSAFETAFIISAWCGPEAKLERYKEYAECGFNLVLGGDAALAREAGLRAIVSISLPSSERAADFAKVLDAQMAKYASEPATAGYFISDEPDVDKFAFLGAVNQYLLQKDPRRLPYINLLPNYAGLRGWNGPAYEQSVARYIDEVKPGLLSWDHYRQMFESGDESLYWKNLEIIRTLGLKARIPMIQIIVSLKHMGYRECSEADLRWQVYTSLAYGSHGIIYFTYWDVPELAWANAPALMTMDGKRDAKWWYVQKINRRIAMLGPTLLQVTSTGVYHTDPIPPGGRRLIKGAPVKKAEGGVMAIGCFVDRQAREYILVVNRSFNAKCRARLTLNERIVSAEEISQETGRALEAVSVSGKTLDIDLEPGDGRLYGLSRPR